MILLFALYVIDAAALSYGINLPVAILYGPLLYMIYTYAVKKPAYFSYLHIAPFLLLSFIYILACFGILFNVGWVVVLNRVFFACYYIVIPLSLISYCSAIFFHLSKIIVLQRILIYVCAINIAYALLFVGLALQNLFPVFLSPLSFKVFPLYFFPALSGILLLYYLFAVATREMNDVGAIANYKEILSGKSPVEVAVKLKECFEGSDLHLNPLLTLEILAEKMEMTKHQLSFFLNNYMGKTFYQIVAEYRVGYAKKRLEDGNYITIETLAYECGFNSKTSLNKYFKLTTGIAPSQYRSDIK